jgi:hypothetical protein
LIAISFDAEIRVNSEQRSRQRDHDRRTRSHARKTTVMRDIWTFSEV